MLLKVNRERFFLLAVKTGKEVDFWEAVQAGHWSPTPSFTFVDDIFCCVIWLTWGFVLTN